MDQEPRINDVRLGDNHVLEYFDGTSWVPYPDVPDDNAPPNAVSREDSST